MASSAVPGIWRSFGGPPSRSSMQCKSYSNAELDSCDAPTLGATSRSGDLSVDTPFSTGFPLPVPKIETFGADTPICDKNAYARRRYQVYRVSPTARVYDKNPYSARRYEGDRVSPTSNAVSGRVGQRRNPMLKFELAKPELNEEDSPVGFVRFASRNVAEESCHDSSKQPFVFGKDPPIGSADGRGATQLPSSRSTREAVALLQQRQQQGLYIDSYMFVEILKRCLKEKDLTAATLVHDCIIQSGMERHPYVATSLVNVYIKCQRLELARRVFDGFAKTGGGVITWSNLIGAYARNGCGVEAYRLFLQMKQEGFTPDAVTYLSILNASASAGALEWVKEVHGHASKAGLESDVRVGNALVHMYAKSGSLDDARLVFDRMGKRDVVTWNVMIGAYAEGGFGMEAYGMFLEMNREGFIPNAFTYASILNASASAGALEWVKDVHSHALKAGLDSEFRVGSALVHMYAKSGTIDDARRVFNKMEKRDVVTWTVMIGAYAKSGLRMEAYGLFLEMNQEGFTPDAITYLSILNASASAGALEWVKEVHGHARKAGLASDVRVGNALVHMYAKSGSIDDARLVFDKMKKRDVVTWNVMIGAYAESGFGMEAYGMFLEMKREGFIPDAFTYASILNASASAGALERVKEVHGHAREAGLESDVRVANALVHMYAKTGSLDAARLVFDKMEKRDVVTWTVMIGAHAENGFGLEAYGLFLRMNQEGFAPDAITYLSILNASASAGALEWVKEVHGHARKAGLESDVRVGNALVHMYAKSGSIDDARLVFDKMERRDVVTWTVMIGGLAQHGCGHETLELLKKMIADGVKPNETTFVAVFSGCSHAGLLDDGRRLFSAMMQAYCIEPTVVHYNCMVDILVRGGLLEEAKLLISDMPVEPDVATWGALLGGCRTYGNLQLGEIAAEELFDLEPNNASAYVVLANIYAAAGMWEKVSFVHSRWQERGVRKEPGRSWIQVDDKIHEFVVGDTSHPEAKAIYSVLKSLAEELKTEGYIPDTRLVLQDICEEDKELALCSHSEKLAIAYGILHIPRGKPIRVFKNLRVCSDCHAATKFISKNGESLSVDMDKNDWCVLSQTGKKKASCRPNVVIYVSIVNASASIWVSESMEIYNHAFKAQLESDLRVGSALVDVFAERGSIAEARVVFDRLENRNIDDTNGNGKFVEVFGTGTAVVIQPVAGLVTGHNRELHMPFDERAADWTEKPLKNPMLESSSVFQ